jgi:hypothetical protein
MTRAGLRVWAGLAASGVLAAACMVGTSDEEVTAGQDVTALPLGLSAVVSIEGGCTAVKVGPKHLLLAARCVTNKAAFLPNKPIKFRKGVVSTEREVVADERIDAAADAAPPETKDGAADAEPSADASTPEDASAPPVGELIEDAIAEVKIHPSYLGKCGLGACELGRPGGADVADVALIVLKSDNDIPIVPVETAPVGAGSKVLVLSNGCNPGAARRLRARETKLAAADALAHEGTHYEGPLAQAVVGSYVVTKGPGSAERDAMGICGDRDVGAPLFLANAAAVVGVNSNISAGSPEAGPAAALPQANLHARVDAVARHEIGAWLAQGGAQTTKACNADAGCKPGEPAPEAGTAAPTDAGKPRPDAARIPDDDESSAEFTPPEDERPPPAKPAAKPKKKAAESSCSASPAASGSGLGAALLACATLLFGLRRRTNQRGDQR